MTVVSDLLVVAGVAFLVAATLGLVRLPDVFTRAHAVAKAETLGMALVFLGLAVRPGVTSDVVIRLVALLAFAFVGNPTAVHAVTRAARRSGVEPWHAAEPDGQRDRSRRDDASGRERASDRADAGGDDRSEPTS